MDRSSFLRKALLANAAFSTLCGIAMLAAPESLSRLVGLGDPRELRDLGASLLVFAVFLTVTATRRRLRAWAAGIFTAMDIAWVVGTAALLIARPEVLNATGKVAAVVVALVVADFAVLQIIGIRRLTRGGQERDDGRAVQPLTPAASAS